MGDNFIIFSCLPHIESEIASECIFDFSDSDDDISDHKNVNYSNTNFYYTQHTMYFNQNNQNNQNNLNNFDNKNEINFKTHNYQSNQNSSQNSSICQEADDEVWNILHNMNSNQNSQSNSFQEELCVRCKKPQLMDFSSH